ncbi:MAG: RNA-binding protein [Clostridiaceae bacterium]|nr:RNA-binding protein [Clostridiaceae bacterium]
MNGLNPVIGRVVYSKAGRDKGKLLIVIDVLNEDFVLVADGGLRPVERPKKKRIKHLKYTDLTAEAVVEKLNGGKKLLNQDLKDAIRELQELL